MNKLLILLTISLLLSEGLTSVACRPSSRSLSARDIKKQKLKIWDTDSLLKEAKGNSAALYKSYKKLNNKVDARIEFIINLWKEGDGLAIKLLLNKILSGTSNSKKVDAIISEFETSLSMAVESGFNDGISEALARVFAIQDKEGDMDGILSVLSKRIDLMDSKEEQDYRILVDKKKKPKSSKPTAGCIASKELLRSAEAIAIAQGFDQKFVESLSNPNDVRIMECFLESCTGGAENCCTDQEAVTNGLCGCSDPNSRRCDYNIFIVVPRVVWICSSMECKTNQKCICPPQESSTAPEYNDDYYS